MSDTHFYLYVGCLVATGLFLLASALTGLIGAKVVERIGAAVGGLAAVGYGVYLFFIFDGGTVHEYFYVYILAVVVPVMLVVRAVQTLRGRKESQQTPIYQGPPQGAPYQQGPPPGMPYQQGPPPGMPYQTGQPPYQAPPNPVQHQ